MINIVSTIAKVIDIVIRWFEQRSVENKQAGRQERDDKVREAPKDAMRNHFGKRKDD